MFFSWWCQEGCRCLYTKLCLILLNCCGRKPLPWHWPWKGLTIGTRCPHKVSNRKPGSGWLKKLWLWKMKHLGRGKSRSPWRIKSPKVVTYLAGRLISPPGLRCKLWTIRHFSPNVVWLIGIPWRNFWRRFYRTRGMSLVQPFSLHCWEQSNSLSGSSQFTSSCTQLFRNPMSGTT